MTTAALSLDVRDGLAMLRQVEARANDATPLMKDALLLMIRSTQLNFQAQGRPDKWDDLALSTILRRALKALKGKKSQKAKMKAAPSVIAGLQILRDTGRLMQSVGVGATGPFDAAEGFGESDESTATIGTNAPGWQNQEADTRGWRVARPFLLFQEQDVDDLTQMAMDWMTGSGPYATT